MTYRTRKWVHYDALYDQHLPKGGKILEIGVRCGGSLQTWLNRGHEVVVGVDNSMCICPPEAILFKADTSSRRDMKFLAGTIKAAFGHLDAIVDDGSHRPWDQWNAFRHLYPLLRDGGVYCIEDLHLAERWHWRLWRWLGLPSIDTILKERFKRQHGPWGRQQGMQWLPAVHVYPQIAFITKGAQWDARETDKKVCPS